MWLNETLKIKYPLIQGGMANIATGAFAAAVSNAGGLGLIAGGGMSPEMLRENIREAKKLTDKPFGVNLMLLHPQAGEMADIVVEEKVPVVTTGAGMEKAGVDAVIAEGTESGGHVGELTTMALVPQVKAAVNIPVIVAGGVASGKQLLAAVALGADGVQVGTILLASTECPIHQNYKNAIIKAKDTDTTVTGRIAGTPVRILKNKMARTYIKKEKEGAEMMELEKYTLGSLKRAVFEGDVETGSLMSGQVAGMVHEERSLKDIIEGLFKEYEEEKKRVMEVHL